MTFGRPQTIPSHYITLDLPLNQSLDSLAVREPQVTPNGTGDHLDTVCLFTATMQVTQRVESSHHSTELLQTTLRGIR